jgi:hypothetical protein
MGFKIVITMLRTVLRDLDMRDFGNFRATRVLKMGGNCYALSGARVGLSLKNGKCLAWAVSSISKINSERHSITTGIIYLEA